MENELKITVKEEYRDRYARITQTRIGQKIVPTPSFCVQLKDSAELELMLRIKKQYPCERLTTNVVRFVDLRNALMMLRPETPRDIFGVLRQDKYSLFFENQVLLIDKSLEYLYYQNRMHGFYTNPYTPKIIMEYLIKLEHLKEGEASNSRKPHNPSRARRRVYTVNFGEVWQMNKTKNQIKEDLT